MVVKGLKIGLIVDHTVNIANETVKAILLACEHDHIFSLCTDDYELAMVFFPKELTARHTNGQVFTYDCAENFIDSIKLTLLAYPVFYQQTNQLTDVNIRKQILR